MVDLNRPVFLMLKDVATVELEFPDTKAKFPIITITELTNTEDMSIEGREVLSDITYQIDVWDNGSTREKCEETAGEVSRIMTANHFTRVLGRGFKDVSGLHRKMMYFKTNVINL